MTTETAYGRPDPAATRIRTDGASGAAPVLDIVIPVYNEAHTITQCVRTLREYLRTQLRIPARITIADNASTDRTLRLAQELAADCEDVRAVHLDAKGRGRALRQVWEQSDATVLVYMDVDLSTGLNALLPLVAPLLSGHSDLAIGTRLGRGASVVRAPKREILSRGYNLLLHAALQVRFSDAQCGFKAIRTDVARELLPLVQDGEWFFDTELLVLAERAGLRIHEIPVDWTDDPDSRVDVVDTVAKDLRGVVRVARVLAAGTLPLDEVRRALGRAEPQLAGVPRNLIGQLARFALVGVISTVAYAILYLLLHPVLGAQPANFTALLVTAVGNVAANRSFTFGVRGPSGAARHHAQGSVVFLGTWALTAGALAALAELSPHAGREAQLAVLVAANLIATITRFLGMRWIFRAGERA